MQQAQKYCIRQIGNLFFIFFNILISSICAIPAFSEYKT
jgi:hypothetical protein